MGHCVDCGLIEEYCGALNENGECVSCAQSEIETDDQDEMDVYPFVKSVWKDVYGTQS